MADKKINISLNISAQTQDLKTKVQDIQKTLNNVRMPDFDRNSMTKELASLQTRLEKLTQISNKPAGFLKASDIRQAEKEIGNIQSALRGMTQQIERVEGLSKKEKLKLFPEDTQNKIKNITKAIKEYNDAVDNQTKREKASLTAKNRLLDAREKLRKLEEKQKIGFQGKKRVSNNDYQQYKKQYEQYSKDFKEIDEFRKKEGFQWNKKYDKTQQVDFKGQVMTAEELHKKWKQLQDDSKKYNELVRGSYAISQKNELTKEINAQKEAVNNLEKAYNEAEANTPSGLFENLKKVAQDAKISLDGIDDSAEGAKTLINRLENFNSSKVGELDNDLRGLKGTISSLTPEADELAEQINKTSEEVNIATQRAQELSNLKSQVLSFFTITGAVQLFRQAVQSAFETVKELDEAMTEIAVVSDFSVGDMWKQLPKFTEQANQLGKSIRDVYGATTLYVQQGLDLDNSLKLANETLKMAAVAGMDAKDATDAMTSALRGFNMELSETSAQKVNDVYSELAAISAADTQEISTAMSKVASLAHNVNMEFETTASFLTQGIEATREAPETIGTALKTVIARFAEVKSLYTKGQLSGTDEEGETVDVNKVQTALRSAGISMNAFLKGEEGLDKVLLRLSSRWNDLDVLTQRYIATMASGSRQQSRFIAMMDNYAKTTEFVNSAYNSAGSGQRQFEKTLESLEAKLTKLKNAWDEFAMGLTNNVIIKGAVDTLTVLLTAVNKLIDGLSGGHGLIKSVMTLGAVWGGLKLGGNLVDKALASNWVQNKIKLSKGDPETVANIRGTNAERTSYFQKGVNMAKEFQKGFQSFNASDNKMNFLKENLGFDKKQIDKIFNEKISKSNEDITKTVEKDPYNSWSSLEDLKNNLASIDEQYRNGVFSIEDYKNALSSLGATESQISERLEAISTHQSALEANTKKLGTTVTVVGGAFMALAGIFSMFGEEGEKVASTLATIGGVLVGIGQIIPVIAQYGPKILTTITTLASAHPVLAGIVAMVSALITLLAVINANSPEKKLEKLKETTKKAQEAADEASKAYDELASKRENLDKLNSSLEGLTQGSLEWKKALLEVNNEILNLKSQFPDLEIAIDETTGKMSVSNWGDILKKQQEYLQSAQDNLIMATLEQTKGQLEVDNQEIDANKDLTEEQRKNQKAQKRASYELSNIAQLKALGGGKDNRAVSNFANLALQDKLYRESDSSYYSILEKYKSEGKSEAVTKYNTASKRKARYEELFGIGSAEGKGDTEIQEALANQSAMEKYRNQTEKISKLSGNNQALVSAFSGDYTLLPEKMKELLQTTLSEGDKNSLAEALGVTPEQIDAMMATARNEITNGITTLYKPFTDKDISTDLLDGLGYSVIQSLGKQISEMTTEGAKEYLEILEGLSKDDLTYMGTLDLSNMSDLIDGMEYLQSLGKSDEEIKSWWDTAVNGANTYIKSVEEAGAITDKLHAKLASADEVESRFTEGGASSEDVQAAMQAGVELEGYLSRTANGWQLSEEKAKEASQAIKKNAAEQAQAVKESTEQQIESYKKLVGDNSTEVGALSFSKADGTYESGEIANVETATKVAKELGLAVQGEKETTEEFIARTQEAYENVVSMLNNSGSILQTVTQEAAYASAVAMTAAEAYNSVSNEKGLSVDDKKTIEWAAQNEAVEAGADLSDLQAMQTYLQANNEALKENSEIAAMVTSQNAKMNLGLGEIMSSYEEWTDLIDESTGLIKVGSVEDAAAFNKLKASVNKMLNTSVDLSDSFWDNAENIYALKKAAEGSEEALGKLQKAAAIDYLQQIDLSGFSEETADSAKAEIQSFVDYLNSIELPKLEIGDTLDDATFIQKFNDMASAANLNSQQIQEAVKAMGFSAKITYAEDTRKVPVMKTQKKITKWSPFLGATEWEEQTWQSGEKEATGMFPVVETLTSSGSSGGGISISNQNSGASNASKGPSGGSSSEKKETTWENPYDKLYNLTEKINESLRQREKLEREYDRILERRGSTFRELRKNYNSQLQSLQKEIDLQNQLRAGRLAQLNALSSETYKGQDSDGNELIKSFADWGVTKYGSYDPNTGLLKIDWNAIDAVKDENKGGAIEAYISRLEELEGQIEDIDAQIEDFQDKVTELQKEGMQDYLDFEQKVYDAIVNQQQQLIDDYQNLSDKINDSNSKILDSIQRSIDLQRQIRDNTKTEEDINEKEARLAYLRQDTSNGNLMEIKQLEEELGDDRQNYEDSLIDQQLDRLTQQNDDAQTARERQIELMQAQLDYASKNGEFWNQTYELLSTGFSADGKLSQASQLWNLLKKDEGWKGMSKFGKLNWQQEISKAILSASNGYANWNMYKAEKVDKKLTTKNGRKLKYDGKNWKDSKGNIYKGVDYDSTLGGFTYIGMTKAPSKNGSGSSNSSSGTNRANKKISIGSRVRANSNSLIYSDSYGGGGARQYYANDPIYTVIDENNGYYLTRYHKLGAGYTGWFRKQDLTAYKTGGIADFTGPAWLDGTKSNPELILNARDTENFIALKDILSSIMDRKGLQNNTQSVGDMYFNIDINVDELSNDYDVEDLSKKIKQELTDSAMYRNVNLVNFIR